MQRERGREIKVGLLMLVALVLLGAGIFLIGEKGNLFTRKNEYFVRFRTVSGLNQGNPVQLNGVNVGSVKRVVLPQDPSETTIRVELSVDRRYEERIRGDSKARIKTLGLLGDKYVEVTTGSVDEPVIPSGSQIPAAEGTAIDQLMASGEDVMTNVTEISSSLKNILDRMEQGEGLLGEMVTDSESGKKLSDSISETLDEVREAAHDFRTGDGILPRLIRDAELADRITGTVGRLEGILAQVEGGEGMLPALINDGELRVELEDTLASLRNSVEGLGEFSRQLQEGDGLLQRLVTDEDLGRELTDQLQETLRRLNELLGKVSEGDGTLSRLVNDPQVYEALNDIVVGVNESKLLRWLVRNRQRAGIEERYGEAVREEQEEGEPHPP